jgi:dihydrolipoamide dehydrogenase
MKKFDLIVLGAGPGGYVAAIRAAQLGLKTAIIEANHLGGICLNWGCIPTKALLKSAEIYDYLNKAEEYGLKVKNIEIDFDKIIQRSRNVATSLSQGIEHLIKKNNISLFNAYGRLNGKNKVRIFDKNDKFIEDLEASNIIIATGAKARTLPHIPVDAKDIITYKEAMTLAEKPDALAIIGSGAIGIEFASFYNALGVKVTVIEISERILPAEDSEISGIAEREFSNLGISIKKTTIVKKIVKNKNKISVELENKKTNKTETIIVDKIIQAVGVNPNIEDIGIKSSNIKIKDGYIVTNDHCETDEKNIYAIGDVTKAPWLAHKASHEAVNAVEHIAGLKTHKLDINNIPGCTYSNPQLASVGLTEDQAKEKYDDIKVGRFPFMANGKSIAIGKKSGMIKVIFNKQTGELLGAHLIGADVTELISNFVIAKNLEATEEDLFKICFPHPTQSEAIHEAILDAFDKAIHI